MQAELLGSITSTNKGLFSRKVLESNVKPSHKKNAEKIYKHFALDVKKSPYILFKDTKGLKKLTEADTERHFIEPVLDAVGLLFKKQSMGKGNSFPDFWLFSKSVELESPEELHRNCLTVLEAKKYKINLDKGDPEDKESPVGQLLRYIKNNREYYHKKSFGVLTNGRTWRFYNGPYSFYEIDLDSFILGHRALAIKELSILALLLDPDTLAFDINEESKFLKFSQESRSSWQKISTELEDRSDSVILSLVQGLYEESPDSLENVKEKAFEVLYRVLFILYSESKQLYPLLSSYYKYSLFKLIEKYTNIPQIVDYGLSENLNYLFELYRKGQGRFKGIGGEFFEEKMEIQVKDKYLLDVLKKLTVFDINKTDIYFFDYSSLDVEVIGNIYENTMNLDFEIAGDEVTIKKHDSKKGSEAHVSGTTYTPQNVVEYIVENTLPTEFPKKATVCDPACGSGHFLIQALRYISLNTPIKKNTIEKHVKSIAVSSIFGNDKNPLAAKLCRLMLTIETQEKSEPIPDFRENIKSFDSLLTRWKDSDQWLKEFSKVKKGFDYILGNPPYVRADEGDESVLPYRREVESSNQYQLLEKKWDLYVPFIELALGLAGPVKGSVGLVVDCSLTYAPFAECVRKFLHETGKVKLVSQFSKAFPDWAFPACVFVVDGKKKDNQAIRRLHVDDPQVIVSEDLSERPFFKSTEAEELRDVINSSVSLTDAFYASKGMVLHGEGTDEVKAFKKKELLSSEQDSDHPVLFLDSNQIGLNKILSNLYIEFGGTTRVPKHVYRATFPELHSGERLLLKRSIANFGGLCVSGDAVTSDNIVVLKRWCDLSGVQNRSINSLLRKKEKARVDLESLSESYTYESILGIFLSKTFRYYCSLNKKHKHNISPDTISELPLPQINAPVDPSQIDFSGVNLSLQTVIDNTEEKELLMSLLHHVVVSLSESNSDSSLALNYIDQITEKIYLDIFSLS